jgi:hypothetical protein
MATADGDDPLPAEDLDGLDDLVDDALFATTQMAAMANSNNSNLMVLVRVWCKC